MKLFGSSFDSFKATALAVILTAAMLVALVLLIFIQSVNELKAPLVRLVSTGSTPRLIIPQECKYHIFVSHIWATGQDKVHKIVRMLKLYIQGVQIWLDVDVLENLSDLEECVKESALFILFYSEGYFKSVNCRREVVKAMKLRKPIMVLFEQGDISIDRIKQMKEEFSKWWPQDASLQESLDYIFGQSPILWISKGLQFSLESIKLVAGRLLESLPYYEDNAFLLNGGLRIDGEIEAIEMYEPLDILYCSSNIGALEVAQQLAEGYKGDIDTRAINVSCSNLQRGERKAVMLVYLNKQTFKSDGCYLGETIDCVIEEGIQIVLVHENDVNENGCEFWEIIEQTPEELKTTPNSIYSNDIAVSLYSIDEYKRISLHQILSKMGARPTGSRSILGRTKVAYSHIKNLLK